MVVLVNWEEVIPSIGGVLSLGEDELLIVCQHSILEGLICAPTVSVDVLGEESLKRYYCECIYKHLYNLDGLSYHRELQCLLARLIELMEDTADEMDDYHSEDVSLHRSVAKIFIRAGLLTQEFSESQLAEYFILTLGEVAEED